MATKDLVEKVLKSFDNSDSDEDEEEFVPKNSLFDITKEQQYEFKVAFNIMSNMFIAIQILFSENNDGLPKDKIYDLFQMLGYTFQQHDLDEMLRDAIVDLNGNYTLDVLLEAFEIFRKNQLPLDDLSTVYEVLGRERRVPAKFPAMTAEQLERNQSSSKAPLNPAVFDSILRDLLPSDQHSTIHPDDGKHLADEISSSMDRTVTFRDFVKIFNPA